jgi:hypothetical protein
MPKKSTKEEFIINANIVHCDIYDYSLVNYINSKTKVIIICKEHGPFEQRPNSHISLKSGCPYCSKVNSYELFINKANKIHNNKYEYPYFEWINYKTKINIYCKNHNGYFSQTINTHLNGSGCTQCNKNILTNDKFLNKNINSIYDYSKVKFNNCKDQIIIICPIHKEFTQNVHTHYSGSICPKCSKSFMDKSYFIEKASIIHDNMYDYSLTDYKKSNIKVTIICKKHGPFDQTPNSHLAGQGCPDCKKSKGELEIVKILKDKNIKYEEQKTYINCVYKRQLKFDFYLTEYNTCVEFDGLQHNEKYRFEKNDINLKERQKRDKIKNDYCKNNNINLLRIPYTEYNRIEEIITEYLKSIDKNV